MEFIDLKKQYQALKTEIDDSISEVLNSNSYILGEQVSTLESKLCEFVDAKYCITCANGTDALSMALKAMGISKQHAVFVPTFTFFATAEVVSLNGSGLFFVDIDKDTFNISAKSLEATIKKVISEGKYIPKLIIPVDLFGQCADYAKIRSIANKYDMLILEDGAQGFGGSINDKMACSFGDIATTSFFPAKPLGCYGDGGAIFTDRDNYAEILRSLRFHGKGSDKYDNIRIGYNSRLDTVQAAVLLVKLNAFKMYELKKRQQIAKVYDSELQGIVKTPKIIQGFTSSYAQYTLTLENETQRDTLRFKLGEKGIPTMIYYPKCLHQQTAYDYYDFNNQDLQNGIDVSKKVLSIPMHPYLENYEIEKVVNGIKEFL